MIDKLLIGVLVIELGSGDGFLTIGSKFYVEPKTW